MGSGSFKSVSLSLKLILTGIICASVFSSPYILDFTLTPRLISLSFLLLLSVLFLRKEWILKVRFNLITVSVFSFTLFCCLSYLWAHTKSEALFEISRNLVSLVIFILACYIFHKSPNAFLDLFLKFCILLVFIGAGVAVSQALELKDFSKESFYQITGINGHKNLYSSFIFLNLFFLMLAFSRFQKGWKLMSVAAIIISLGIIILLRTKAVWIGTIISACFFGLIFLYRKIKTLPKFNFYVAVVLLVIACNIAFVSVIKPVINKGIDYNNTVAGSKQELDKERLMLWDKTFGMFQKHKVTGVGAGNWQIFFPDETLKGIWRAEDLNFTFQRPHNDALWLLSETGLIGFNLFLLFIFSLILFSLRALRFSGDKATKTEISFGISFAVGFFVISLFDFPKERIEHLVWINIILAFLYINSKKFHDLNPVFTLRSQMPLNALALILVFVSGVGILRYKGEMFTRKVYNELRLNNSSMVVKHVREAENFAYTLDPTSVPLAWYSGNAYAKLNNYNSSKSELMRAYVLNPYNRNVLNDLASACVFDNDTVNAKKYYLEATRISPRFDDAKLNLAALYIREKNYRKASECLKSLLHDSERRTNYETMVNAFLQQENNQH